MAFFSGQDQKELMLFLRGIRKHKQELSTLITDNFHIVKT